MIPFLVAGTGLEPMTFGLWAQRAANCSTPQYIFMNKLSVFLRCKDSKFFVLYNILFFVFYKKIFVLIVMSYKIEQYNVNGHYNCDSNIFFSLK